MAPRLLSSFLVVTVLLACSFCPSFAGNSTPRAITDEEIKDKKMQCYGDVESGLWGSECQSSHMSRENCVLRCQSPICYKIMYESDPLERGERDTRAWYFKYCMHKISVGETLEEIEQVFNTDLHATS